MASPSVKNDDVNGHTDRYNLLFRLQILSAIGCLFILLYALRFWFTGDFLRIFGVGILVAAASLIAGFLLGFIFGIPRDGSEATGSKATPDSGGSTAEASTGKTNRVKPNSNLIEISDWLTKIIVGVGLVELKSLPGMMGTLSYYLGLCLRPTECAGHASGADFVISGQAAGLAIMVLYSAMGFLWGYVWTRLYFTRDLVEQIESLERKNENLQRDKQAADLILVVELLVQDGRLSEAMRYIDQALKNDPKDGRATLTKARILKRQATKPGVPEAEKQKLLNQAIDYANKAIALLPEKAEPYYNKACYQALKGIDRNAIFANLESAFGLDPGLKETAENDDDLAGLQHDDDFKRLTGENAEASG